MHAKPEKVGARRFARRVKAVASIAVALAAGVFLACQKTQTSPPADGSSADDKADAVAKGEDAAGDVAVEAAPLDAMVVADAKSDALAKPRAIRDAAVDVREHRRGMPVPDNLLE
jgi:hypothetical protein